MMGEILMPCEGGGAIRVHQRIQVENSTLWPNKEIY